MDDETREKLAQLDRLCFAHHMRLINAAFSDGGDPEVGIGPSSANRHAVLEDALRCPKCLSINGLGPPVTNVNSEQGRGGGVRVIALVTAVLVALVMFAVTIVHTRNDRAMFNGVTTAALPVGACIRGLPTTSSTTQAPEKVQQVDCALRHSHEVVGRFTLPNGPYPGEASVRDAVTKRCENLFVNYVGLNLQQSGYGTGFTYPSESNWSSPKSHVVVCFATGNAQDTGSARALGTESGAVTPRQPSHVAGAQTADGKWDYVPDLKVGDCARDLRSHAADWDESVIEVVGCTRPHDDEIFATFRLRRGQYPGDHATAVLAARGCRQRLERYVGPDLHRSSLRTYNTYPSIYQWPDSRGVVCAIESPKPVTSSVKSNR